MKNIISVILILVFTTAVILYANKTYQSALKYESITDKIVQENMLDKKLNEKPQDLISNLLGAFLGQKIVQEKPKPNYLKEQKYLKEEVQSNLMIFTYILLSSLLIYLVLSKVLFLLYLNIASLVSLGYGIFTPIFSVLVQKDLPIVGYVVLEFDSNTLLSSIEKLYIQENYFVAGVICLFSIIFPLFKTLIMSIALFVKNNTLLTITKISSILSKWSMIDVFVLAIFLVYLSSSTSTTIVSEVQAGFYMFFSYVILSLISSTIYNLGIKNNKNKNNCI
ncbi:MAG TPA: hypothetical protein EYG73_01165 [Arcobacter sp.]|nr:hypothetical protein [Arcobacter sp.]